MKLLQLAATLGTRAIAMTGLFGVGIITARLLGPEDRGIYFLTISLAQIAAQISNFGLHASNTYVAAQRPELLSRLAINSLYVAILVTPLVALGVVSVAVLPDWSGFVKPAEHAVGREVFAAVFIAPVLVAFLFLSNLAIGVDRVQLFNGVTVASSLAALIAAATVALIRGTTLDYLIAAALASLVSCLLTGGLLLHRHRLSWGFDAAVFRDSASFAFRAYIVTLLSFLVIRVGAVSLQLRSSPAELGQFSVASQLFDALMVLPGTVGLLLFPDLVRLKPAERWPALWRTFRRFAVVMVVLISATGLSLPFVIPLFFGGVYSAAIAIALALLPSAMIFALITVLSQALASEGYPRSQIVAWTVGLVLQAVLSFVLAGPYGGVGVSVALCVSSLVVFVILSRAAFMLKGGNGDTARKNLLRGV